MLFIPGTQVGVPCVALTTPWAPMISGSGRLLRGPAWLGVFQSDSAGVSLVTENGPRNHFERDTLRAGDGTGAPEIGVDAE